MNTQQKCPGATDENPHNLVIDKEDSDNKLCDNTRCYFLYEDKNKVGYWQPGFDPITAKTFLKPMVKDHQ